MLTIRFNNPIPWEEHNSTSSFTIRIIVPDILYSLFPKALIVQPYSEIPVSRVVSKRRHRIEFHTILWRFFRIGRDSSALRVIMCTIKQALCGPINQVTSLTRVWLSARPKIFLFAIVPRPALEPTN
jgi:hypothetical protein